MTEVECTTRQIGGSIGVILPKELVEKESIGPNQKIRLRIKKTG